MRILLITPDYAAGPLASLTHHVAHALVRLAQREGHQVRVGSVVDHTDALGSATWVGGAAVTALHTGAACGQPAEFAQWVQAQPADAIHCIAPTPQAVDLPWPQGLAPTVVTLTGLPGKAQGVLPGWLHQARHRVCASAPARDGWQTCGPALAWRVLPHGVDLLALLRQFPQPAARLSAAPEQPLLASASPSDVPPSVRWVPLHPVSLLGLDGAVDAVVMPPPAAEAFSLVVNECAALGLPCLEPSQLSAWLARWPSEGESPALQALAQPMPMRIEEEAFFYDCLYRM